MAGFHRMLPPLLLAAALGGCAASSVGTETEPGVSYLEYEDSVTLGGDDNLLDPGRLGPSMGPLENRVPID